VVVVHLQKKLLFLSQQGKHSGSGSDNLFLAFQVDIVRRIDSMTSRIAIMEENKK
jgi:hypothetical protein